MTFRPRAAMATYEPISGAYVLYLTPKPVACNRGYLAAVPYLISGKTFAFKGTFAARWCGKV